MSLIDAVLFDMDGVLVDSEPAHNVAMCDTLAAHGLPVPNDEDWERVFLGRPDRDGYLQWLLEHHITADVEALLEETTGRFTSRFAELVTPFPDGQWLARALCDCGVPLALVTGARRVEAEMVLATFSLEDAFIASVSADDVTRGKPDPEPYRLGAERAGFSPLRCAVIEDSVPGIRSAEAAGASLIITVDRIGRPERFAPFTPAASLDDTALTRILVAAGRA